MDRSDDDNIFITQSSFVSEKEDYCENNDLDDFKFRFGEPVSEADIEKKCEIQVPKTTRSKSGWAFSTFARWQAERRQRSITENLCLPKDCLCLRLEDMSPTVLNNAMKYFLFEARREDAKKYTADTVHGLFCASQSGLKLKGAKINLFEDEEFEETWRCLDSVKGELSREGRGSFARKSTEIVTHDDEEQFWRNNALGEDSPKQLLDTILSLTGLHFALRGGREHRALRLFHNPQIAGPHTDHQGSSGRHTDTFYFMPSKKKTADKWYTENAVGHNTLSSTVKQLCQSSGVGGKKSNHSLRATAATRLYQAQVDEQMICEVTGHRSEAVRTYKRTSDDQRCALSDIICKSARKDTSDCKSETPTVACKLETMSKPADGQPDTSTI